MGKPWRVEVEWEDSTILQGGWEQISDILQRAKRAPRIRSVGFILADTERRLVIAASVHGSEAAGVTVIPRGQIVKVKRLG